MAFTVGNILFNDALDSFASVDFADEYHEKRGNVLWANIDDDRKEQLLIKASDYVKDVYFGVWKTGLNLVNDVPIGIAQAVVELALVASATPLSPNVTRGKKKVKVGPIEVEYDGNAPTSTLFMTASLRIAPYLNNFSNGIFAKLVRC